MSRGYIKLHRGWHDDDVFGGKYCERGAWCWLLTNVAWKDTHRRNHKGQLVAIERGQMHTSFRALSGVWGWSVKRVETFLNHLETATMIATEKGQSGTLLTICNYDKYQARGDSRETASTTDDDTVERQSGDTQEEGKERKEDKNKGAAGPYAFIGKVIRLNAKDYEAWAVSYPQLDLRAELQCRDDWLATQDSATQARWFLSTSNWLRTRNDEARRNKMPAIPI